MTLPCVPCPVVLVFGAGNLSGTMLPFPLFSLCRCGCSLTPSAALDLKTGQRGRVVVRHNVDAVIFLYTFSSSEGDELTAHLAQPEQITNGCHCYSHQLSVAAQGQRQPCLTSDTDSARQKCRAASATPWMAFLLSAADLVLRGTIAPTITAPHHYIFQITFGDYTTRSSRKRHILMYGAATAKDLHLASFPRETECTDVNVRIPCCCWLALLS